MNLPKGPKLDDLKLPRDWLTGTYISQNRARSFGQDCFDFKIQNGDADTPRVRLRVEAVGIVGGGPTYGLGKYFIVKNGVEHLISMKEILSRYPSSLPWREAPYYESGAVTELNVTEFATEFEKNAKNLPEFQIQKGPDGPTADLNFGFSRSDWSAHYYQNLYCSIQVRINLATLTGISVTLIETSSGISD